MDQCSNCKRVTSKPVQSESKVSDILPHTDIYDFHKKESGDF